MYDRAPRLVSDQLVGSTPSNVGPGTYELKNIHLKGSQGGLGYAPFLSLSTRKTIFNVSPAEAGDPGPGTYNPTLPQDHVKGCRTLANKSTRFNKSEAIKENTPGPGKYNLKGNFEQKSTTSKSNQIETDVYDSVNDSTDTVTIDASITKSGRPQKILTGFLRSDINKNAVPSIPSPGQSHGYIEKNNGQLIPQKSQKHDRSMGPAYYNPQHKETKTTRSYKGVHFGVMTGSRTKFKGMEGPAPCDYDPWKTTWGKSKEKVEADSGKIFDSQLPRYHQLVQIDEKKRGVPGPGKYDILSQFEENEECGSKKEPKKPRPGFGCQEMRFGQSKNKTPAPGRYNDPRNALEALKKISGMKRSPFGQTSIRFDTTHSRSYMLNNTPGPGTYNILNYGMSADSMKRAKKASKHGGFGSTSLRIAPMVEKDAKAVPGPAQYSFQKSSQPAENRQFAEDYKNQMTSAFASHVNRLAAPTTRTKLENPPPGSYEVAYSYEKSQSKGRQDTSKPRNKLAYLRQRSFLSSAPRFGKMGLNLPGQLPVDPEVTVSSATYKPKSQPVNAKLSLIASKDDRFKSIKSETPGPGTYHLSPLIDSTVLKGTYNVTLNNPVPKEEINHDKQTRPNTTAAVIQV